MFSLFLLGFGGFVAQDKFGITHSNYAPTKTLLHYPTDPFDNKTWFDIHLTGLATLIVNDFFR
tara:strand:- start:560 stop:748 length:189 start_codon:yes stop_codon:yes gene_type:complete